MDKNSLAALAGTLTILAAAPAHAADFKAGDWDLSLGGIINALRSNADLTGGLYYALTKSLTLTAELSRTESKDVTGDKATMNGVAVGGILFF